MSTINNKVRILFLTIPLLLTSCGDSPFLKKETSEVPTKTVRGSESSLTFPSSKIKVETYWRKGPNIGDESKLLIILLDDSGAPVNLDQKFKIKLWMPSMGHGSFPVQITKVADGVFEATEVFFTMPGFWNIHFQLFTNKNLDEEVKWDLDL